MNTSSASSRPRSRLGLIALLVAAALVASYFWPKSAGQHDEVPLPASTGDSADSDTPGASNSALPPGAVSNVGGIPVDAEGHRILNEAGLPLSDEPLPVAKPIPVKAPTGAVVGYTKDAQGNTQPVRAGELKQVPNTPGSFVVVDMWADGGPAVVPPTQGKHLTEAELAKLRAQEKADQGASPRRP